MRDLLLLDGESHGQSVLRQRQAPLRRQERQGIQFVPAAWFLRLSKHQQVGGAFS
jgi:hypothetical protein